MAGDPKRKRAATTTRVPDRSPGVPLGHEAHQLARFLQFQIRRVGASDVPAVNAPGWSEWLKKAGGREVKLDVQFIEWAIALLQVIPERPPKRKTAGRPTDPAVEDVKRLAGEGGFVAEAARLVAHLRTPGLADTIEVPPDDGAEIRVVRVTPPGREALQERRRAIDERTDELARAVYRGKKRALRPKPKRKRGQ